ncbi:unnamed protein product [Caretta caretta]
MAAASPPACAPTSPAGREPAALECGRGGEAGPSLLPAPSRAVSGSGFSGCALRGAAPRLAAPCARGQLSTLILFGFFFCLYTSKTIVLSAV